MQTSLKFMRATATKDIYIDPKQTRVAIITCGGIVPGMNVVIRNIVHCLETEYGVADIHGVKYGFQGLCQNLDEFHVKLTADSVKGIHYHGGSILGTCKAVWDTEKIL